MQYLIENGQIEDITFITASLSLRCKAMDGSISSSISDCTGTFVGMNVNKLKVITIQYTYYQINISREIKVNPQPSVLYN